MQETATLIIFISAAIYTGYRFINLFLGPEPSSGCGSCTGSCNSSNKLNKLNIKEVKNLPGNPFSGN